MPPKKTRTPAKATKESAQHSLEDEVQSALTWLKRPSTKGTREGMARYGIPSDNAFGVTMANMKVLAKRLGRNHELAAALWDTGWYEARMLTSFVDEPARVTPTQMDRWCRDFDNWGICDTVCFHLFDRTPHAWQKVAQWCDSREEFVKRAAFALLWGLTVHDKHAVDEPFAEGLLFIERAATDERHFVKKSVNMALRAIGKRNPALNTAAVTVARRLADSPEAAARWVGKDALRELTSPAVIGGSRRDAALQRELTDDELRNIAGHYAHRPRGRADGVNVRNKRALMQTITPFLWFDGKAEEAMNFYVSVFKNSKIGRVTRVTPTRSATRWSACSPRTAGP